MSLDVLNFDGLVEKIQQTHFALQVQSVKAVNMGLTMRNWLIGFYIVEFEQNGEDRAKYGTALVANIAKNIQIKGLSAPELSRCRQFYKVYPEMFGLLTQKLTNEAIGNKISRLTTDKIFGLKTQKLDAGEITLENELKIFIENELKKTSENF